MSDHDSFLDLLLTSFPNQVSLVNRYADVGLELPTDGVLRVFIPDLHWMSSESGAVFPGYHFNRAQASDGSLLFLAFLKVLGAYRARPNAIEVYQLGDRFDLWRESTLKPREPLTLYNRIRHDAEIEPLADEMDALGTRYIRGNHDHWLKLIDGKIPDPGAEELTAVNGAIFLTHGHRYDQIEFLLADSLKAEVVRRYPQAKMHTYDVGIYSDELLISIRETQQRRQRDPQYPFFPAVKPGGAVSVSTPADVQQITDAGGTFLDVSIFSHADGEANDFENHISFLRFGGKIHATESRRRAQVRRVYVIGHSHNARMFVDRHPRDGGPLVTMDCGGWIEQCTIATRGASTTQAAHSAQVGFQCGNDLRIYQLTGK